MAGWYEEAVEVLDEVIEAKKLSPELYNEDGVASSEARRDEAVELRSARAFEERMRKIVQGV